MQGAKPASIQCHSLVCTQQAMLQMRQKGPHNAPFTWAYLNRKKINKPNFLLYFRAQ